MRFYQNILTKFILQIPRLLAALAISIIIARILGPEQKGAYELISLIPTIIVLIGNLGFPVSNVYFIAKKENIESKILGNTIFINLIISIISIISLYFLMPVLKDKFWNRWSRNKWRL